MRVIKPTPFELAPIVGKVDFPNPSLTVIVKGTFDLVPGRPAVPAKEPLLATGDEFYDDDEEMQGPCRYESDFAYFKPRADLLLVGSCYAPGGIPVPRCRATFQVGAKSKSVEVFGERHWKLGLLRSTVTDPEPFTQLELRYENSFGGAGYQKNPVGKGRAPVETESGEELIPLPNIEDPNALVDSPRSRTDPAGFAPPGKLWQERLSKLGTFDEKWLKQRWPWFPEDFDWSYFSAAPPDMQVDGYLKGDEPLYFENLHPEHPQYRSRLPGLRVRCFLNELADPQEGADPQEAEERFREVPLKLDTLWVDMETEQLVLVWRGVAAIRGDEFEEVQHVVIRSEPLEDSPAPVTACRDDFRRQLDEEQAEFEPEEPQLAAQEAAMLQEMTQSQAETDAELLAAEAQMRKDLVAAGIDPDAPPPEPTPEQKEEEARMLKELGIEEPVEEPPLDREKFQERLGRGESFAGEDLSGLDLSDLDMKGVDFQGAILAGVALKNTDLTGADLSAANLAEADFSGANLSEACLKEADLTQAKLVGVRLTGAALDEATLEKAQLEKAALDRVTAVDATFAEANLTGANLQRGDFSGADFSKCLLSQADFRDAKLNAASMGGAIGIRINMARADLTNLRAADGCDFSQGNFQECLAPESDWEEANLTEADFSFSEMEAAIFTSAVLQRANLYAANLKFAQFTKANLREARLARINLFEGSLEKADLVRTDLRGANLYGAELLEARLEETKLDSANVKMTKLAPG